MNRTLTRTPQRQSLHLLRSRSGGADEPQDLHLGTDSAIDTSRWFVCPTLTPLYYTRIYRELGEDQRRRYNQLTALSFNELIAFFEGTFASAVLAALRPLAGQPTADQWSECLNRFLDDEQQHIRWWRELNRLSEPQLYADGDRRIIRLSPASRRALACVTAHPQRFPVVFWIMLALEERSLDISRRCLRMDRDQIEPRYRLVYQQHLRDETRHVQMDWHLIDRFFATRSRIARRLNARLLAFMIGRFFLPPSRSAVRVVRRLVAEHPELRTRLPEMVRQLKQLGRDPDYHDMMYSRSTTPILFSLFDQFDEMHVMRRVLLSYHPQPPRADADR